MNIPDIFYLGDGQLNWDAISTIFNIILSIFLVSITLWNVKQVRKQTGFMKKDRLAKEMDKLVAKLDSNRKDDNIFRKENPYDSIGTPEKQNRYETDKKERDKFWIEIEQNKYLAPYYLCSAIDNYIKNIRYGLSREDYKAYEKAKNELHNATRKRWLELQNELEEKTWIKKAVFWTQNQIIKFREKG